MTSNECTLARGSGRFCFSTNPALSSPAVGPLTRFRFPSWLLRKSAGSRRALRRRDRAAVGRSVIRRVVAPPGASQAAARAVWWRNSFMRLWVAVISLHSERQADLPRRWKRSMRRLNFVSANTGSIIPWRFR